MNWGEALIALDTGERCRYRGIPVIVAGVEIKRLARINNETAQPYCIGDRFYSCRLLGAGKSGGTLYEGRLEELQTEEEYLVEIKNGKRGINPMDKKIKERFGILIRPTGRFEIIQLGITGETEKEDDQQLGDALRDYFGGDYEWARNYEELAYITRDGAFFDGLTRNDAASYLAGIGRHGDCIVLPKKKRGRVNWTRAEAYRNMIKMECDWQWERDYRRDPDKYIKKLKKA